MRVVVTAAMAALLATACGSNGGNGGDGGTETPAVYGAWSITSIAGVDLNDNDPVFLSSSKYLRVESDDTFAVLNETSPNGFHAVRAGVVSASTKQVGLDGRFFNYTVSGNTLTLSRPNGQIVATRAPSAPAMSAWVVPAVASGPAITLAASVGEGTDLAWDGSHFWVGTTPNRDGIQQIALDTGEVSSTIPTNLDAIGMGWDGTHFWVSSDGQDKIYKIDNTGAVLETSPTMGAWVEGIAFDGTKIWAHSNNEQTLYAYVPGTTTLTDTIPLLDANAYNAGLEYANGFLYLASGNTIYKIQTSPLKVVTTYSYYGLFYISGIGFDGTDFYVFGDANPSESTADAVWQLQKVTLP
jgi:hypothetical protein